MGKPKAPAPPDYSALAAANEKMAEYSYQTSQDQLAWAKEQYKLDRQVTDKVVQVALDQMNEQQSWAERDRDRYEGVYQPLENQMITKAQQYSSKAYQEQEAGKAQADVSQQFQQARTAAQDQLEAFGIDPTQVRSGALDVSSRMQEAAARAGAGNQARENTDRMGTALMGSMVDVGKGYPGQVAQAMAGSSGSGNSAVNAGLATTGTGSQAMGTPTQYLGAGNQALGNWGSLVNGIYSTQMEGYKARLNSSSGIGGAIGGILGGMMSLSDENAKENIAQVGQTDDGQPIYKYNYKGDPETRMGLIAQDVEQSHPEAVATGADGLKRVNYDAALQDSAIPTEDHVTQPGNGSQYAIPPEVVAWKGQEFFEKLKKQAQSAMSGGAEQAIPC
jgi:hypothetical protein